MYLSNFFSVSLLPESLQCMDHFVITFIYCKYFSLSSSFFFFSSAGAHNDQPAGQFRKSGGGGHNPGGTSSSQQDKGSGDSGGSGGHRPTADASNPGGLNITTTDSGRILSTGWNTALAAAHGATTVRKRVNMRKQQNQNIRPVRALFCLTLKNPVRKFCIRLVEYKYPFML